MIERDSLNLYQLHTLSRPLSLPLSLALHGIHTQTLSLSPTTCQREIDTEKCYTQTESLHSLSVASLCVYRSMTCNMRGYIASVCVCVWERCNVIHCVSLCVIHTECVSCMYVCINVYDTCDPWCIVWYIVHVCVSHTLLYIYVCRTYSVSCVIHCIYIYIYIDVFMCMCIMCKVSRINTLRHNLGVSYTLSVCAHSLCLNIHSFSQCVIGTQCLSSVVIHCVIHCMCIYIYIYVIHTRCVCPLSLCQHTFLHILAITTCILPTYTCVYKYIGVHHVWCIACLSSCHQTLCACTFSLRVSCVVIQCES